MRETESQTKKETVFQEWADVTTAHGFFDYSRSKTLIGKVTWFILIFACLTLMIYQLFRVASDYSKHEWTTTMQEKAPDPGGVEMPKIIICNINRLKWSKAMQYNITSNLISYFFLLIGSWKGFGVDTTYSDYANQFSAWQQAQNLTYLKMFELIGPNFDDIIVDGPTGYNFTTDAIYTFEYGRCQRINLSSPIKIVGSQGGISMLLDVQSWDYVPLLYNNFLGEGLVIQMSYSGNAEIGQWIKLHPGTQTSIALQAVQSTVRLQDRSVFNPFNYVDSKPPCDLEPTLQFLDSSLYSPTTCMLECQMAIIVRECNCVMFYQSERFRTCEIEEIGSCLALAGNSYATQEEYANAVAEDQEKCFEKCTMPCYDHYVETAVSTSKFPSDRQRPQLEESLEKKNLSHVQIEDIIVLEIYFSSLSTQVIERYEAMSLEDLISNSGGLIGVWAGMSFLTLFQAISFLIKYFEERKQRKLSKFASSSSGEYARKPVYSVYFDSRIPNVQQAENVFMPGTILE